MTHQDNVSAREVDSDGTRTETETVTDVTVVRAVIETETVLLQHAHPPDIGIQAVKPVEGIIVVTHLTKDAHDTIIGKLIHRFPFLTPLLIFFYKLDKTDPAVSHHSRPTTITPQIVVNGVADTGRATDGADEIGTGEIESGTTWPRTLTSRSATQTRPRPRRAV